MVGDQQRPGHRVRQVGLDLDAERVEHGGRPGLLEQQPAPVAAQAERGQRNDGPGDDQQGQPEKAEGAGRARGLVQSAFPR